MTRARTGSRASLKRVALRTAIGIAAVGCLYAYLSYRSLSSEFRALGLR